MRGGDLPRTNAGTFGGRISAGSKTHAERGVGVERIVESHEVFADMFVGWVYDSWGPGLGGANRRHYMNLMMNGYLDH